MSAVLLAALICLLLYSVGGPRGVPLRRGVPADAGLCLAMIGLEAQWPQVASSDLRKKLIGRKLLTEDVSPVQGLLGREALAFYSPASGLCVASRLTSLRRGAEMLWRLWKLSTDGDWSRERWRGVEIVRIEQRGQDPALTYFVYGDAAFLMIGADPSQAREEAALVLGEGGWGGERLAGFAPGHFMSLYLHPDELMKFDLRGEYEKARERYGEENLPPCWKAVEEANGFLLEQGGQSLFDLYSDAASSMAEGEEFLASLDIAGENAVLEWHRVGASRPSRVEPVLERYASLLPGDAVGVAAFLFHPPAVIAGNESSFSISPADADLRGEYEKRAGKVLSSLDGAAALAAGRPSLFSSLLPACAIFKLKSAADISSAVNGLLDVIGGRTLELRSRGFSSSFESTLGHRKKEHGGREYFILERSGPFSWSYAQIGDVLVVATHRKFIESIMEAASAPGLSLSSSPRFMQVAEPLGEGGEAEGFLDLKAFSSQAMTALSLYALQQALTVPHQPVDADPFAPLRTALEVMECMDSVAWEGGAGGGRVVIPLRYGGASGKQ